MRRGGAGRGAVLPAGQAPRQVVLLRACCLPATGPRLPTASSLALPATFTHTPAPCPLPPVPHSCRPHHRVCERHFLCAPPGSHPEAAGPAGAGAARRWVAPPPPAAGGHHTRTGHGCRGRSLRPDVDNHSAVCVAAAHLNSPPPCPTDRPPLRHPQRTLFRRRHAAEAASQSSRPLQGGAKCGVGGHRRGGTRPGHQGGAVSPSCGGTAELGSLGATTGGEAN